jgi:DNA-binding NtrC family response regulator
MDDFVRRIRSYAEVSAFREAVEAFRAIHEALWHRGDAQAAWAKAERLRLDGNVPVDLLVKLLTSWGQLALTLNRLADAATLLKRAEDVLPKNAPDELESDVRGLEGMLAGWRGDMVRREKILRQMLCAFPAGSAEHLRQRISQAHFLALMGRESEVDAGLGALDCLNARTTEHVLLIRLIQAVETGRFADGLAMADAVRRFDWDMSGHRNFFIGFLDLIRSRWRIPAGLGVHGGGVGETDPERPVVLPLWAEVMDHLLANRPAEALACAKREAGGDLNLCLTKTGFDSFNLIRAELANGNWQAAVRLIGLRRGRGNIHYLDDYFLAVACLLAGQRADAATHFARVEKACAQHGAFGRLEFELRMACALRPGDLYWLTRAAAEVPAAAAAAVARPLLPAAAAKGLTRLIGPSEAMTAVRDAILRVAQMDAPVLVTGETGVGKELVARAVHESGPRADATFLAVNCGAISESLLESELFGYEKGAFTGAAGAHRGLFEMAGAGTILLDEIGEISPRLQVGLLRVLESGEIRPVGGTAVRSARCRIIAATNAEIDEQVDRGSFRKDLYYRLARLTIHVPPLRDRRADIVPLALHFLAEGRVDGELPRLSAEIAEALCQGRWPGNVRELRNTIERMRLFGSEKAQYELADLVQPETGLPAGSARGAKTGAVSPSPVPADHQAALTRDDTEEFLKRGRTQFRRLDRLRELFRRHGKLSRTEVARVLGISLRTATMDLRVLCRERLVEKVEPTASPCTHYFRLATGHSGHAAD